MADEAKPPYVRFETRVEEDRQASIDAGHFVGRDVDFAFITSVGSRDTLEKKVEDWFTNLEAAVRDERIPALWLTAWRAAYEDFKKGRETPESGMAIKDWPGATPSQIRTLLDINCRTVEDLAEANAETLMRIGMGGQALKQKAITWLETSKGKGKQVEKINALQIENSEQKQRIIDLEKQVADLTSQLALKKEDA